MPLNDYLALSKNGTVIEADGFGDKVILLNDSSYLKLFRRKNRISSAALYPYAQRFADNAKKLEALNIPCPKIIRVFHVPELERDVVHYQALPGHTLRQLREEQMDYPKDLQKQFLMFVRRIHQLGVFFRSMHLGNVVLSPDGRLGLIDIADLKVQRRPLNRWQVQRNLRHIMRYPEDAEWLSAINFSDKLLEPDLKGQRKSGLWGYAR